LSTTQALLKPSRILPGSVALILFLVGSLGGLSAAWGYGLLLVATVALAFGVIVFLIFIWLNSQNEGMASSSPPRGRLLAMAGRRVR